VCGSAWGEELGIGDVTGAKNWNEATSFTGLRHQFIIIIIIVISNSSSSSSSRTWSQIHVITLTSAARLTYR